MLLLNPQHLYHQQYRHTDWPITIQIVQNGSTSITLGSWHYPLVKPIDKEISFYRSESNTATVIMLWYRDFSLSWRIITIKMHSTVKSKIDRTLEREGKQSVNFKVFIYSLHPPLCSLLHGDPHASQTTFRFHLWRWHHLFDFHAFNDFIPNNQLMMTSQN